MTTHARFPYTHSGEPGLPRYLLTRAEGLPLREALGSAVSYLRKYRHAKRTAPPEEVRYFDAQRHLLRQLMAEGSLPNRSGWRLVVFNDDGVLFLLPGTRDEGVSYWNAEFGPAGSLAHGVWLETYGLAGLAIAGLASRGSPGVHPRTYVRGSPVVAHPRTDVAGVD